MPHTIMGYVIRFTGAHQVGLALLSVAVFLLSAVPLELQRRIVNDVIGKGTFQTLFWLAAAYAAVALAEQSLKLVLNVYRGWVAESTVRRLRNGVRGKGIASDTASHSHTGTGVEITMVLEEAEPIGGFTGVSLSEPLLQGGILVSVIGYMLFLEPRLALLGLAWPSSFPRWCSFLSCSWQSTAVPRRAFSPSAASAARSSRAPFRKVTARCWAACRSSACSPSTWASTSSNTR
jgi:ABC-type multidrug transport system fused ATPase/permease subunit